LRRATGSLAEQVARTGPGRFGILAVDSSKKRFAVMLTDFAGNVRMEMQTVENTAPALDALIERVKAESRSHRLKDLIVGIERTGRYHVPIQQALRLHWTVEIVDPFAVQQLRQASDPGNKTDGTDLPAIARAIRVGLGTREADLPPAWLDWRQINRAREDDVRMRATLRQRIQERIEALLPGFARLFKDLWSAPVALRLAEHYGSAAQLVEAGSEAILAWLRTEGSTPRRDTVEVVLGWARTASPADPGAPVRHQLLGQDFEHERFLTSAILGQERKLAASLTETPVVLLLAMPGINVVAASGYGAELGPIEHYLSPQKISGRAGLYPSRYQSDEVDYPNGPLVGHRNARLRDAILEVAYCLSTSNPYFKAWAALRAAKGWPHKKVLIALAKTFIRISYRVLAGRQTFDHPCARGRDAILRKLYRFARSHEFTPEATRDLLLRAAAWLPGPILPEEAQALREELPRRPRHRPSGPEHIRTILPAVIEHLVSGRPLREERRQLGHTEVAGGLPGRRSGR
jgi:transposase